MAGRRVHHGDGLAWLRAAELAADHAIVTSLPDVSELDVTLDVWRSWFVDACALVCERVHPEAVAIFYQTDVKRGGCWIDKGHLVHSGADRAGAACLWHKVVCRTAPGQTTFGRPAFGHWMAFSREMRVSPAISTADVLPQLGEMTWSRAMPMSAAQATCAFLHAHTGCRVVVDPFCGRGTMLAVANDWGLDAVGVELSHKRVRKARALTVVAGKVVPRGPEASPAEG